MPSQIDASKPEAGNATTESVRAQFATARDEISALQAALARALANGGASRPFPVGDLSTSRVPLDPRCAGSLGTIAAIAGRVYAIPFVLGLDLWIDALSLSQTTSLANTIYAGIAADDYSSGLHRPGEIVAAAGSLATSGSGEKLITFDPFLVQSGIPYWLLFGSSAAPTFRSIASADMLMQMGWPGHVASGTNFIYAPFDTSLQQTCDNNAWTQTAGALISCLVRPCLAP